MKEGPEGGLNKPPSKLKQVIGLGLGIVAGAAAGAEAQTYPPGFGNAQKAMKEMYGLTPEAMKAREKQRHFDAFARVKKQSEQKSQADQRLRDSDFKQKLGDEFGVNGNWHSNQGKKFEAYFKEWLAAIGYKLNPDTGTISPIKPH